MKCEEATLAAFVDFPEVSNTVLRKLCKLDFSENNLVELSQEPQFVS